MLASLATIVLAAYAREHWREPGTVYIAVRAQSARPLSPRLTLPPPPAPALPGEGPHLDLASVLRMESGEGALDASLPRPAPRRHEYPRGPPRA